MKYSNLEWTIGELINLIESQKINLRPPYQRNFIWSSKDQKLLIDSIRKGYPLPNFFILKNKDNTFEMVDVNPEKPDVPLNKNDAFQKVQKRRVQEKR